MEEYFARVMNVSVSQVAISIKAGSVIIEVTFSLVNEEEASSVEESLSSFNKSKTEQDLNVSIVNYQVSVATPPPSSPPPSPFPPPPLLPSPPPSTPPVSSPDLTIVYALSAVGGLIVIALLVVCVLWVRRKKRGGFGQSSSGFGGGRRGSNKDIQAARERARSAAIGPGSPFPNNSSSSGDVHIDIERKRYSPPQSESSAISRTATEKNSRVEAAPRGTSSTGQNQGTPELATLKSMGFDHHQAQMALEAARNDMSLALDFLQQQQVQNPGEPFNASQSFDVAFDAESTPADVSQQGDTHQPYNTEPFEAHRGFHAPFEQGGDFGNFTFEPSGEGGFDNISSNPPFQGGGGFGNFSSDAPSQGDGGLGNFTSNIAMQGDGGFGEFMSDAAIQDDVGVSNISKEPDHWGRGSFATFSTVSSNGAPNNAWEQSTASGAHCAEQCSDVVNCCSATPASTDAWQNGAQIVVANSEASFISPRTESIQAQRADVARMMVEVQKQEQNWTPTSPCITNIEPHQESIVARAARPAKINPQEAALLGPPETMTPNTLPTLVETPAEQADDQSDEESWWSNEKPALAPAAQVIHEQSRAQPLCLSEHASSDSDDDWWGGDSPQMKMEDSQRFGRSRVVPFEGPQNVPKQNHLLRTVSGHR